MSNPRFMTAMEGAVRGKEKVEDAVSQAITRFLREKDFDAYTRHLHRKGTINP